MATIIEQINALDAKVIAGIKLPLFLPIMDNENTKLTVIGLDSIIIPGNARVIVRFKVKEVSKNILVRGVPKVRTYIEETIARIDHMIPVVSYEGNKVRRDGTLTNETSEQYHIPEPLFWELEGWDKQLPNSFKNFIINNIWLFYGVGTPQPLFYRLKQVI